MAADPENVLREEELPTAGEMLLDPVLHGFIQLPAVGIVVPPPAQERFGGVESDAVWQARRAVIPFQPSLQACLITAATASSEMIHASVWPSFAGSTSLHACVHTTPATDKKHLLAMTRPSLRKIPNHLELVNMYPSWGWIVNFEDTVIRYDRVGGEDMARSGKHMKPKTKKSEREIDARFAETAGASWRRSGAS